MIRIQNVKTALRRAKGKEKKEEKVLSTEEELSGVLANNRAWAREMLGTDPLYFARLVELQKPEYLWIGCSDSRVPANEIVGLKPGELFVHRNVANVVSPADINCGSVISFAVEVLKVKHIIVTGHYGCGGVRAAMNKLDQGSLEIWLAHLRLIRNQHQEELAKAADPFERLVELNVKQQVVNVARIPAVQAAWGRGESLGVHGLVYSLQNGLLTTVCSPVLSIEHLSEQIRVY